jgi:hypothetical protein
MHSQKLNNVIKFYKKELKESLEKGEYTIFCVNSREGRKKITFPLILGVDELRTIN